MFKYFGVINLYLINLLFELKIIMNPLKNPIVLMTRSLENYLEIYIWDDIF